MHEYDLRGRRKPPFDVLRDETKWAKFRNDLAVLFNAYDFGIVVCAIHKPDMQAEYTTPFHPYNYSLENIIERTAMVASVVVCRSTELSEVI